MMASMKLMRYEATYWDGGKTGKRAPNWSSWGGSKPEQGAGTAGRAQESRGKAKAAGPERVRRGGERGAGGPNGIVQERQRPPRNCA